MAGVKKVLRCLIKHGGGNSSIFLRFSTLRTYRTKRKLVGCRHSDVSICNYRIAVVGYDSYAFTTRLSHSSSRDSGVRPEVLGPGLRRPWKPIESPYNPYNSPDIPCQLERTTPLHPRPKRVVPVSFSVTLQPNETSPSKWVEPGFICIMPDQGPQSKLAQTRWFEASRQRAKRKLLGLLAIPTRSLDILCCRCL